MPIKLKRKVEPEYENTPIKLPDNLFSRIRDLSKQTDMTPSELVIYFIEEALEMVEFEDGERKEEPPSISIEKTEWDGDLDYVIINRTISNNTINNSPKRIIKAPRENGSFNEWITNLCQESFSINPGEKRKTIIANVKYALNAANIEAIEEEYKKDKEKVEKLANKYLEACLEKYEFRYFFRKRAGIILEQENKVVQHRFYDLRRNIYKKYGGRDETWKKFATSAKVREEITKRVDEYLSNPDHLKPLEEVSANNKLPTPSNVEVEDKKLEVVKTAANAPISSMNLNITKFEALPNTDKKEEQLNILKRELYKKNPDDNLGSHFSETYKYLNRVYGIDINEEKKMYRKKYGVRASGIDAVMANEEIWTLFINKLQNILDIDLTKMA